MKYKKYEYFIEYTIENLLKYNEEYFWKKGFDADVYLILNPAIIKKVGGGKVVGGVLNGGDNIALSIPYRYFDQLIQFLKNNKEDESTESKQSIFSDAIRKIQIWVNYLEDNWNKKEQKKEPIQLSSDDKSIIFDNIDNKEGEKIITNTVNEMFINEPYPSEKPEKQIKIESNNKIPELEKENEESEILEERVFENTREYKILNR